MCLVSAACAIEASLSLYVEFVTYATAFCDRYPLNVPLQNSPLEALAAADTDMAATAPYFQCPDQGLTAIQR